MIPVRTWQGKIQPGKYRQEMFADFDANRYQERNKAETAFSVLKRRLSGDLKARKYRYHVKEIKSKLILHNLTRATQSGIVVAIVEDFNKTDNLLKKSNRDNYYWKKGLF